MTRRKACANRRIFGAFFSTGAQAKINKRIYPAAPLFRRLILKPLRHGSFGKNAAFPVSSVYNAAKPLVGNSGLARQVSCEETRHARATII